MARAKSTPDPIISLKLLTLLAVGWMAIGHLQATEIIQIDDFNEGTIAVSAASGGSDGQTESGLDPSSVISGVRQTQVTATAAMPTTVSSAGSIAEITYPIGSVLSTSNIDFIYNAGNNTFPSPGLGLDLTNMVAFRVDVDTPVNIFGFQLRIFDQAGNSKVATKNAFANTSATYTFLPTDFTGGSVYANVHSIRLTLGGISSFNLSAGSNVTTVDNFVLETALPPELPRITAIDVDAAGDVTITLDGSTTGLDLLQSPDLATAFTILALDPGNISANSFTIPSTTLATIDGGTDDGTHYFKVAN